MGKGTRATPVGRARPRAATGEDELVVHLDAPELGGDQVIGRLRRARARGTSVISFDFDAAWVGGEQAFFIDPALNLYPGPQYLPALPGIFADTTPDRWGRVLLRLEVDQREGRSRVLDDWDFLVGVRDDLRMGALRLARPDDGVFVAAEEPAVPPLARLRDLEQGVRELERGDAISAEIKELIAPGSPLGGNRPKANFRAEDGRLWLAKFPSRSDEWDVAAWEFLLNQIAGGAGVAVPETRLLGPFHSEHHTFAAARFDRSQADARRLFASAMTLTQQTDHDDASYLDIARAIVNSGDPTAINVELEQLFRRVVFNVLVGHRDDHLRNHGFVRTQSGWRLAPAYDLNPRPDARRHELALDGSDRAPDLALVISTADMYRLTSEKTREIVDEVRTVVRPWRERASDLGIRRGEIDLMRAVFSV